MVALRHDDSRRLRGPKPPDPKELALQIAIADVLKASASPDWRWTHFPAGEERDKRHAAKLKAMGLRRGWPNFILVDPTGRFYGLELKRQGEALSEDQEAFEAWCSTCGIPFAWADTKGGALGVLKGWGAVTPRAGNGDSA